MAFSALALAGDRASRSVGCSHIGVHLGTAITSGHATDTSTTPGPWKAEKKQKTASRGSLSLDKGSPHKCSAWTRSSKARKAGSCESTLVSPSRCKTNSRVHTWSYLPSSLPPLLDERRFACWLSVRSTWMFGVWGRVTACVPWCRCSESADSQSGRRCCCRHQEMWRS
jgi:hypothetical protein